MKNALIILFLIINTIASATDYYISSSGNDANNGLSSSTPWKTINKVNSVFPTIYPGDRILFKRGDTFYGTIRLKHTGIAGNPITIEAYGTGADPIITGFTTISGWTNETGGIYSKVITCESAPNMVTIDGVNTPMGRWPNKGWRTIDSHSTNVSITDADLPSSPDWDGAEVVIRKNHWVQDRNVITNHTGTTITYKSATANNASNGFGYFIENDLATLDSLSEWYYDPATSKFYMYFGAVDPTTKIVKVATLDELISSSTYGHITLDNLNLQGANSKIISLYGSSYFTIQNCNLSYSGSCGVYGFFGGTDYMDYFILDNSKISECNNTAINFGGVFRNATISNNKIYNIGIIAGMGESGWGSLSGINNYNASGTIIEYNELYNIGYIPIIASGNNVKVRNNYIHNYSYVADDGGGIYTQGPYYSGIEITNNIVLDGIGAPGGTTATIGQVYGIYLDDKATDVLVSGNTVSNCSYAGIFLHNAHENIVTNNVSFDNDYSQMLFVHDDIAPDDPIANIDMDNNIFFAKESTQRCLSFITYHDDIARFGTADYNYYARPIDDNLTISTMINGWGGTATQRTLTTWQSYVSQDTHSQKSSITVSHTADIVFCYNATKTNKVISLPTPMIDVKGTKYVNSITLLPYTSKVLMVDPDPSQPVIPVYLGSAIENATPAVLEMSYNVTLVNSVPSVSAFSVQVNSIIRTVNAIAVSGTKVQLSLASPVVYGDIVTVTYTKPTSNPLQATSTGIAASISNQPVVNNCINSTIAVNQPPVVTISNPRKGNKYEPPAIITIDAVASDPDGIISKVELYNGTVKLVELTSVPYTFTWKDVKAGAYSITAIATDNSNATTTSLPIEFEVGTNIRYDANSEIINLYPNPNDGHFSIQFINPLENEKSELVITDLAGKKVYSSPISKEETTKQIDLSCIKSGIYILMIIYKEILITKKIIKY